MFIRREAMDEGSCSSEYVIGVKFNDIPLFPFISQGQYNNKLYNSSLINLIID